MTDLASLRPLDGSVAAITAALRRTDLAAKGAAAEIGRLRETRARLLMSGSPAELAENGAELSRATTDGQAVMDLHQHLQRLLESTAPEVSAEEAARAEAFAAVERMTSWWQIHGPQMIVGLQSTMNAAAALANWQAAASKPGTPPPSNVTHLQPRPPGAA